MSGNKSSFQREVNGNPREGFYPRTTSYGTLLTLVKATKKPRDLFFLGTKQKLQQDSKALMQPLQLKQ